MKTYLPLLLLALQVQSSLATPASPGGGASDKWVKPTNLTVFMTQSEQQMGRRMFADFVKTHVDELKNKRRAELAGLNTPDQWRAYQNSIRVRLDKYFGKFPQRTPLNPRVTGKLEREHYTIEKVIFESQPQYFVTANLYVPKGRAFPLPGVVFTCGHYNDGKAQDVYQMTCQGLVLKGYVVLIFDPLGQGERSEYFDPESTKPLVEMAVSQHQYVGRPAWLVDWTLAGSRLWDAMRAVDYLASRPEVDETKLASVGQSGGGQMALLITAVDQRIKVCAASGPGGSCENMYLSGRSLAETEILSLIPPRPLRIVFGKESGEEPGHRKRLEDLEAVYEGLGVGKTRSDLVGVPEGHTMNQYHREAAYEWLNQWFDRQSEGKAEAVLEPEKVETLWCTEKGNTIISLGGETGQTLNAKRAGQIYKPELNLAKLRERVAARIGLRLPPASPGPQARSIETVAHGDIDITKMTYESEPGINIPALLIKSRNAQPGSPTYIFVSDKGKPITFENSGLPFRLANHGSVVLAMDVRGIGETSPTPPLERNRFTGYTPLQWAHDALAIDSLSFGRTTLGMRTFDVLRGIDFLNHCDDLKGRKIVVVGEGLGGLWALLAAAYNSRVEGVVTMGTLPSYSLLIANQYYDVWGYFWVPGALRDFDIPDLARLASPKPQVWIDPVNALGEKLDRAGASSIIGSFQNLHLITSDQTPATNWVQRLDTFFK